MVLVSNSFIICYVLLLYICSSQGCIAAPFVLIILDTVLFIVIIKGSSPEAKPTSFACQIMLTEMKHYMRVANISPLKLKILRL